LQEEKQKALEALERAVDDGFVVTWWLTVDPIWDAFRSDAGYQRTVKRIDEKLQESRQRIDSSREQVLQDQ